MLSKETFFGKHFKNERLSLWLRGGFNNMENDFSNMIKNLILSEVSL